MNNASPTLVCTGCSLLCNDLDPAEASGRRPLSQTCCLGAEWMESLISSAEPEATIHGKPAARNEALRVLAGLLQEARMPLICGLADQTNETIAAALELARLTHAAIDWTGDIDPFAWHSALQQHGQVTCSLGEMEHHADEVVVWEADPDTTHPRWQGTSPRPIAFVAARPNATSRRSSKTWIWSREEQLLVLRQMREWATSQTGPPADASAQPAFELWSLLRSAHYPVIVVDDSFSEQLGNVGAMSLCHLVRILNQNGHCRLIHLARQVNRKGAESVFLSVTGAPFGVLFREGRPLFRSRDAAADVLVKRGEVDLVLFAGHRVEPALERALAESRAPFVSIGMNFNSAIVHIPAGKAGLDAPGTAISTDGTGRILRPFRNGGLPDVRQLLGELIDLLAGSLQNAD